MGPDGSCRLADAWARWCGRVPMTGNGVLWFDLSTPSPDAARADTALWGADRASEEAVSRASTALLAKRTAPPI